jgi:hypothetical protein
MKKLITKFRIVVSQLALFYVLASCLGPIDVDTDDASGSVVIAGQVSTVPHRNFVQVGQTAGTERQSFAVSNLSVWIADDLGNMYICYEEEPGKYSAPGLTGVPGRAYHVLVEFPQTGIRYQSKSEILPAVIGTDQVTYDFTQEEFIDQGGTPSIQPFLNFRSKVDVQASTVPYYLKWTVNEIYLLVPTDFPDPFGNVPPPCYVSRTTDPQRVVLYDGRDKAALSREFFVATRLADAKSFHSKHSFYVYRSSITADAYEYWRKVNVLVSQVGSIFDTPPAEITGNVNRTDDLSETVYGYFQATNETYYRKTLYAFDMPYAPTAYCEYDNTKFLNQYLSECLNCLNAANSRYEEPELFRGD